MLGVTLTPPKKKSCPQDLKYIHIRYNSKYSPSIEELTITQYTSIHEYEMWKIFHSLNTIRLPRKVYYPILSLSIGECNPLTFWAPYASLL